MLTQPPLTQTLGPWVERSGAKPANALADEMELLTALEAALPPAEAFLQHFSPTMLNALPFFWAGYRLEVRYTYRLEGLGSEEALWDGLRGNIRREIRKARKRVEVRDDLGLDRFHAVWAKTFARQGLAAARTRSPQLERLDAACAARGRAGDALRPATRPAGSTPWPTSSGTSTRPTTCSAAATPSCARAARAAC